MNREQIERERRSVIEKYGEWTDHNIQLTDDVYTIAPAGTVSPKLQRILQIVSDISRKPLREIRVLDLACLEGQYAIEFALQGAQVLAIEGRETSIEKARFAKRALNLQNLEFLQGDVCELSPETHGRFDVVLCLGILYHLDHPDVFSFIERIANTCNGVAVFDTYVALAPIKQYTYKGRNYFGREVLEHDPAADTEASKRHDLWSAIRNNKSVWVTKATLYNMLMRTGFTSIYECDVPLELNKPLDRVTVVAIKGQPAKVRSSALMSEAQSELPENWRRIPSQHQQRFAHVSKRISHLFPQTLKREAKRQLRAWGLMKRKIEPWEWADPFRRRED